jgi:Myb-like DNA-binding domain
LFSYLLCSEKECRERWILVLSKPRKTWTEEEDAFVVQQVMGSEEQPFTRWSALAEQLPGRKGKQVRDRFTNYLNPNIRHHPFTMDEDRLLWKAYQKLGPHWVDVSMKFFNAQRSENQLKNRWNSVAFKTFVTDKFGPNVKTGATWFDRKVDQERKRKASSLSVPVVTRCPDNSTRQRTVLSKDTAPFPSTPSPLFVGRPAGRKKVYKRTNNA